MKSFLRPTSPTKSSYEMPFYDKLYQSIRRSPGDEGEPPGILKFNASGLGVDYSIQREANNNGQSARINTTISNELYGNTENSGTHRISWSVDLNFGTTIDQKSLNGHLNGSQETFGYFMFDYGNSNQVKSNSVLTNKISYETETSIQIVNLKIEYNYTNKIFKLGLSSSKGLSFNSGAKFRLDVIDKRTGILKN